MPLRFIPWALSVVIAVLTGLYCFIGPGGHLIWLLFALFLFFSWVGFRDLMQNQHAILHNYPLTGHLRFLFEFIRPEIRQYFLESDNEEIPFSRAQRALVYQRAKGDSDKRPFGTLTNMYQPNVEILLQKGSPTASPDLHSLRVTVGGSSCTQPYAISLFNISAMSFGALSANAIMALNRGAQKGGFAHDTGEGSVSSYHRKYGGDLIWEIGSGYFGCRTQNGRFDPERFKTVALEPQVKMIEIKLSQGAKPGHGGVLPGAKVTREIAEARGVRIGQDCISPAAHPAFSTPIGLIDFISELRRLSGGKPVGFKLCIGEKSEFLAICKAMIEKNVTPDFIVVDGTEGGTGAAPLEFTDHIGMPLRDGLSFVHSTLIGLGLRDQIKLGAAGKITSAFDMVRVMALGADWCNAARGFMFALGCIQSQSCHTDRCPVGVATQDPLRQRALVVPDKAERVKNFHTHTLEALAEVIGAAGLRHPSDLRPDLLHRRISPTETQTYAELYPTLHENALIAGTAHEEMASLWRKVSATQFNAYA